MLRVPVNQTADWFRVVAGTLNALLNGNPTPFVRLDAAPADPVAGQCYYNTVANKARIWTGAAWIDLH